MKGLTAQFVLSLAIVAQSDWGFAFQTSRVLRSGRSKNLISPRKASVSSDAPESQSTRTDAKTPRVSIIVCPAQFCVPDDYNVLFENLVNLKENSVELGSCKVAPLPRTEWIKVARQLPSKDFLDATLPVHKTLGWYFDAIEQALAEIFAEEGPDARVCIIGHSIGGWVARAYLGGLSRSSTAVTQMAAERVSSLITLGTPHISPESALVDQTRGLLREIAEAPACSSEALTERGIDITCVCSSALNGSFLTTDVEQLVAASSYLPLLGKIGGDVSGDGIVPLDLAFMESPARKIEIEKCEVTGAPVRHSHVLPTPWNLWDGYAPSIKLPDDFVSYVSDGVIPQWARYIR